MAVENGRQHERLVEKGVDALLVSLDANNAVLGEGPGACTSALNTRHLPCVRGGLTVSQEANALQNILDDDRLEDVQLWLCQQKFRVISGLNTRTSN